MDTRSLFGFMIVFVLLVVAFQIWGPKKQDTQPAHPEQKTQTAQSAVPAAATTPGESSAATSLPTETSSEKTVQAAAAAETTVENELYRITFTNRGGDVKSWILKKFKNEEGKPLDLVNADAAGKFGVPLSLFAYDEGLRNKLNSA